MTTNPYPKHHLLVFLLSVCIFGSSNASCQNNQIIQEQLDSLRQSQKEQSEKQKNSDDTLIFIKEQLADIQKRLNQVVTADALDQLQKEVDALNIKFNGLSTSKADKTDLDALQKKIDDMQILIGNLTRKFNDLETKFNTRIQELEDKITAIQTQLASEISSIKIDIVNIQTNITSMKIDIKTTGSNITIMEGKISTMERDINTMRGKISTVEAEITKLETKLKVEISQLGNGLKAQITTLENHLTAEVKRLEDKIAKGLGTNLGTNIAILCTDVEKAQRDLTNIKAELKRIKK